MRLGALQDPGAVAHQGVDGVAVQGEDLAALAGAERLEQALLEDRVQQALMYPSFLVVAGIGLILVFMTITEFVSTRRALGQSYLPTGLKRSITGLFDSITNRSDR